MGTARAELLSDQVTQVRRENRDDSVGSYNMQWKDYLIQNKKSSSCKIVILHSLKFCLFTPTLEAAGCLSVKLPRMAVCFVLI